MMITKWVADWASMPAVAVPFRLISVSYSAAPCSPPIRPLIWPLRRKG